MCETGKVVSFKVAPLWLPVNLLGVYFLPLFTVSPFPFPLYSSFSHSQNFLF